LADKKQPNVFEYDNYRKFLADWLKHLKNIGYKLKKKDVSLKAGLSPWYLGKVLRGHRSMTDEAFLKFAPLLNLAQGQITFLKRLRDLNDAKNVDEGEEALKRVQRFDEFKQKNLSSLKTHQYLTEWYYPVIREMVEFEDFQLDPLWIRKRLKYKVTVHEILRAIQFLLENEFIKIDGDKIVSTQSPLSCEPGVHRVAMSKYHEGMLSLSAKSIYDTAREERKHLGHVVSLSPEDWQEVRRVLDETLDKLVKLTNKKNRKKIDSVYQISLTASPLTIKKKS
jgi:uncharacterized protein (TIGR02147 family)